jgi:nucleoside phosphorylase
MILVVAATQRELAGAVGLSSLVCGIGPVEAAAATAAALAASPPAVVLHVGIAGVRRDAGVAVLDVVAGSEARYCDAGDAPPLLPDPRLLAAVCDAVGATALPIGTSARVGGTRGVPVEAMEGYAVLWAAARAHVPAIEVRVVSNEIDEPDRARWRFEEAFAKLAEVVALAAPAVRTALSGAGSAG